MMSYDQSPGELCTTTTLAAWFSDRANRKDLVDYVARFSSATSPIDILQTIRIRMEDGISQYGEFVLRSKLSTLVQITAKNVLEQRLSEERPIRTSSDVKSGSGNGRTIDMQDNSPNRLFADNQIDGVNRHVKIRRSGNRASRSATYHLPRAVAGTPTQYNAKEISTDTIYQWFDDKTNIAKFQNFVRKFSPDADRAEVVNDAYIRCMNYAMRQGKPVQLGYSLKTWIYTVAKNIIRDGVRRSKSSRESSIDAIVEDENEDSVDPKKHYTLVDPTPSPETLADLRERAKIILNALRTLSSYQRKIIIMRCTTGATYEEMGQVFGIPLNTAKTRFYVGITNTLNYIASNYGIESVDLVHRR